MFNNSIELQLKLSCFSQGIYIKLVKIEDDQF